MRVVVTGIAVTLILGLVVWWQYFKWQECRKRWTQRDVLPIGKVTNGWQE